MRKLVFLHVFVLLSILYTPTIQAEDFSTFSLRGDVTAVEIVSVNGTYLHTRLYLWSAGESSQILVICNAKSGGSLQSCFSALPFLGCQQTTSSTTEGDIVQVQVQRTACTTGSRKDAGQCLDVKGRLRMDSAPWFQGTNQTPQAITLLAEEIEWPGNAECSVKP